MNYKYIITIITFVKTSVKDPQPTDADPIIRLKRQLKQYGTAPYRKTYFKIILRTNS
jgi:hypothetical protein